MFAARRSKHSGPGRRRSTIVCAALVLSLWRGPVPWIHSHETLEAQGEPESSLAWHIAHFHQPIHDHELFGWHVHLTCPWDVFNEPSRPLDPDSPKPRAVYDMPYVVSQAGSTLDVDHDADAGPPASLLLDPGPAGSLHLDATCVPGLHFLQTYSPSVPLRALISVALC